MFCEKCGSKMEDSAIFCPRCGSPVHDNPTQVLPGQETEASVLTANVTSDRSNTPMFDEPNHESFDSEPSGPRDTKKKSPVPLILGGVLITLLLVAICIGVVMLIQMNTSSEFYTAPKVASNTTDSSVAEGNASNSSVGDILDSASKKAALDSASAKTAEDDNTDSSDNVRIIPDENTDSNTASAATPSQAGTPQESTPQADTNSSVPAATAPTDTSSAAAAAPSGDTGTKAKTSSYLYIQEDLTWGQAQQRCQEMGGHLVHINDDAEQEKLVSAITAKGMNKVKFWIGGARDSGSDSKTYYWIKSDGSYADAISNDSDKWMKGEPSYIDPNIGDGLTEDKMIFYYYKGENRWVWNDAPDDVITNVPEYAGTIGFICEIES